MNRTWNDRQQKAIEARNTSVVVSAAAGSGKTSVLAERVLTLIEEGEDIERMLIVTFTNLAAGEMRERIFRRLQEASLGSPRLAVQAEKCAFADISTIHAFCGKVLRDHFEQAGLSPTFAVADEASIRMLKQSALDAVIDQARQDDGMKRFAARFCSRGDMRAITVIVEAVYNRVISVRQPEAWLDFAGGCFDADAFVETLFDEYKSMAGEAADHAAAHLKKRSEIWRERGFDAQADQSEEMRIRMLRAVHNLTMTRSGIPLAGQIDLAGKVKGAPIRESKSLTNRANACFDELEMYAVDFFRRVKEELRRESDDGQFIIALTRDFMRRYAQTKKSKNVIDHDDMIHFALKALNTPGIAERYKEKFDHVFVDEYQDINDAQDAIIRQVKRGENDFLVGDVKQCIYMFRESNPDLLITRCAELAPRQGLIEMNVNYRSAPEVIGFINGVMQHLMTEEAGGVKYTGGQRLEAGREGDGVVDIVLSGSDDADNLTAEGLGIAAYINSLIDQGFHYCDIAILRPEVSSSGRQFSKVLTDMGIPVSSGFDSVDARFSDVSVFINLLAVIDSPVSDTALLSVMRYPHFGFTESELANIRLRQKERSEEKSFCHAVAGFRQDSALGRKVGNFLNEIAHYRRLAQCLTLPDFLMRLRQEAEFREYALTSPGGRGSDDALGALISAVSSVKGIQLGGVPEFADKTGAAKQQPKPGDQDAVFLTTIHKAKGLEFPVVILSGMHRRINQNDSSGPVIVGRELGVALDILDEKTHVRRATLHRIAVRRRMRRETLSETVRLLYVGMTRAISRLAIFGAGSKISDKWTEEKHARWQHDAVTYFDLIMPAVHRVCAASGGSLDDIVRMAETAAPGIREEEKTRRFDALFEKAAGYPEKDFFTYAYQKDIGVPSKVSVSALKKRESPQWIRPVYRPDADEEITAAQRGTLMHKILQKIGLQQRTPDEVAAGIRRLIEDGVIDAQLEQYAEAQKIAGFLNSSLAKRARRSERCLFEAPFCLNISARELNLAESDESVAVQGVIDMCFLENGAWVIVDYKTDRVGRETATAAVRDYALQLSLYAKALERITGICVSEKYIYYIMIGQDVRLP